MLLVETFMIKGHWIHLFWRFWYKDYGEDMYDYKPLFMGICWERDMTLRNKIACELDALRMYIYNNFNDSEHRIYVNTEIARMECELFGRNIF